MKRKLITVLLSVLAAFSLWLYVITVVSPDSEATFDVYVKVDNENVLKEKGMMLNPEQTPVVHLKLSGNRTDLIKLTNENIMVKVDAKNIQEYDPNQQVQLNYTITYPGNVPNNAITVVSRNPDYIELDVWEYSEKVISVEPLFVGEREEGYMISSAVFSVPQLHISGPKAKIEQITSAKVEIDLTGVKEPISKEMPFKYYDANGQIVDEKFVVSEELKDKEQVKVDVMVQRGKEIPVTVELIAGGGATKDHCTVVLSHKTLRVSGSEENLADLTELKLEPIDLSQVMDTARFERTVVLPAGISNLTGVDKITVTVTVNDLATVRLPVRNIYPKNTNNLQADIYTEVLQVTFRGPKNVIDKLTSEDVTAFADFAGLASGIYSQVPVLFAFNGRFANVGAIGSYTVSAALGVTGQE